MNPYLIQLQSYMNTLGRKMADGQISQERYLALGTTLEHWFANYQQIANKVESPGN